MATPEERAEALRIARPTGASRLLRAVLAAEWDRGSRDSRVALGFDPRDHELALALKVEGVRPSMLAVEYEQPDSGHRMALLQILRPYNYIRSSPKAGSEGLVEVPRRRRRGANEDGAEETTPTQGRLSGSPWPGVTQFRHPRASPVGGLVRRSIQSQMTMACSPRKPV